MATCSAGSVLSVELGRNGSGVGLGFGVGAVVGGAVGAWRIGAVVGVGA
jgi:hypothetical protein